MASNKIRWLLPFILVCAILGPSSAARSASLKFPTTYDRTIKQCAELYLPGVPWHLHKAQLFQESRLDPNARSPVGAEGLAQFMPATWKEITAAMGTQAVDRRMAEPAICASAFYMAKLRKSWRSQRPEEDRHKLALASYNAGLGWIIKAQEACGEPPLYPDIMKCLPAITGAQNARETMGYAPSIYRYYVQMEALQ